MTKEFEWRQSISFFTHLRFSLHVICLNLCVMYFLQIYFLVYIVMSKVLIYWYFRLCMLSGTFSKTPEMFNSSCAVSTFSQLCRQRNSFADCHKKWFDHLQKKRQKKEYNTTRKVTLKSFTLSSIWMTDTCFFLSMFMVILSYCIILANHATKRFNCLLLSCYILYILLLIGVHKSHHIVLQSWSNMKMFRE